VHNRAHEWLLHSLPKHFDQLLADRFILYSMQAEGVCGKSGWQSKDLKHFLVGNWSAASQWPTLNPMTPFAWITIVVARFSGRNRGYSLYDLGAPNQAARSDRKVDDPRDTIGDMPDSGYAARVKY
jgi:hypothetical protein